MGKREADRDVTNKKRRKNNSITEHVHQERHDAYVSVQQRGSSDNGLEVVLPVLPSHPGGQPVADVRCDGHAEHERSCDLVVMVVTCGACLGEKERERERN
jgi:hypothetical protein